MTYLRILKGITRLLQFRLMSVFLLPRRLLIFPESGRPGRIAGTRELIITSTPYVAVYVVAEATVRILRILHGAQQWPDTLPES